MRHRIVTAVALFICLFLFPLFHRTLHTLLPLETRAIDLKLWHNVQNGLSSRSNIFRKCDLW